MTSIIKQTVIPLQFNGETVAYLSEVNVNTHSMPSGTIIFKDWDALEKMIKVLMVPQND